MYIAKIRKVMHYTILAGIATWGLIHLYVEISHRDWLNTSEVVSAVGGLCLVYLLVTGGP